MSNRVLFPADVACVSCVSRGIRAISWNCPKDVRAWRIPTSRSEKSREKKPGLRRALSLEVAESGRQSAQGIQLEGIYVIKAIISSVWQNKPICYERRSAVQVPEHSPEAAVQVPEPSVA